MTSIHTLLVGGAGDDTLGVGSESDRVIGTGNSFPAFPAVIEYNGLLLNYNATYDYYHVNSVDGVDDAEVRDVRSVRPNDDGEDAYGAPYGGRSLVINGEIRAYDVWKADDMRAALQRAFALRAAERPLTFKLGGPTRDRMILCKKSAKVEIPWQQPTGQWIKIPFMIPLRASDPRFLGIIRQSHTSSVGSFSLLNEGNYYAKATVRITGPCTSMTLTRYYEDEVQSIYIGPLASSANWVEIDGTSVVDSFGSNAYNLYSDNSDRMTLGPGPSLNYFDLTGEGTDSVDSSVLIQWRHSWIPM